MKSKKSLSYFISCQNLPNEALEYQKNKLKESIINNNTIDFRPLIEDNIIHEKYLLLDEEYGNEYLNIEKYAGDRAEMFFSGNFEKFIEAAKQIYDLFNLDYSKSLIQNKVNINNTMHYWEITIPNIVYTRRVYAVDIFEDEDVKFFISDSDEIRNFKFHTKI